MHRKFSIFYQTIFILIFFIIASSLTINDHQPYLNNSLFYAPVIGILTQPNQDDTIKHFIVSSYVQFIQEGGGRVIPIRYNLPKAKLEELVGTLNGILIPGGSAKIYDEENTNKDHIEWTKFGGAVQILIEAAIKSTNKGNPIPIMGICLGMQALMMMIENSVNTREKLNLPTVPDNPDLANDYLNSIGEFTKVINFIE